MFQEETFASATPRPFQKLASLLAMPPAKNWDEFRHSFITRWGRKPDLETLADEGRWPFSLT